MHDLVLWATSCRRGLDAGVAGALSCTTRMTSFPSFSGASSGLDAAAHHWNDFFFLLSGVPPPVLSGRLTTGITSFSFFQWCLTRFCQDSSPLERLVFPLSGVPTPILTRQLTTGITSFSFFPGYAPPRHRAKKAPLRAPSYPANS